VDTFIDGSPTNCGLICGGAGGVGGARGPGGFGGPGASETTYCGGTSRGGSGPHGPGGDFAGPAKYDFSRFSYNAIRNLDGAQSRVVQNLQSKVFVLKKDRAVSQSNDQVSFVNYCDDSAMLAISNF